MREYLITLVVIVIVSIVPSIAVAISFDIEFYRVYLSIFGLLTLIHALKIVVRED